MQLFLIKYGLVAVFIAAAIEADVVPVMTGVLARFGYVNAELAVICAGAGALAGDCIWFLLGRFFSTRIQRSYVYRRAAPLAESLTRRLGIWQVIVSHVIYGTRVATMVLCGMRGFTMSKFALVDGLGCFGFTMLFFGLGFGLTASTTQIIGSVKQIELFLLVAVVILVLGLQLVKRIARRRLMLVTTGKMRTQGR